MMGRPSKLTLEVQAELVQAIRAGAPRDVAAHYAGIGARTFFRWMERGERAEVEAERLDGLDRKALLAEARSARLRVRQRESKAEIVARLGAPEAPYRNLWGAIREADGHWEMGLLAIINKVAPMDWRAAAWMLERRRPRNYGRRQAIEMSGPEGAPVEVEHRLATVEEAREVWARLKQTGILDDPEETLSEELEVDEAEAEEGAEPQAAPSKLPVPPAHGARPARPAMPLGSGEFLVAGRP